MLNSVTEDFVGGLARQLPDKVLRPVEPRYLSEPRGTFHGQAGIVAAPTNVAEVATIIAAANDAHVPVIPYGGGTGLVGGQIAESGPTPLLLTMERMSQIRAIYPDDNVMIAEAGAILHDVQIAAEAQERLFPLSVASEGSCRIGGNLSTNAGGVNVLRYGSARDLCLGLEAVLPNGEIWNGLKRLRKDNTGYDLRNLLIGAEGTLGVITAASLRLFARPENENVALMVVSNPAAAVALLAIARNIAGEGISAFELIHKTGLEFLTQTMPEIRQPFQEPPEWMVLIELGLSGSIDVDATLASIFEAGLAAGLVVDGIVAQNEGQRKSFWDIRENIPEANRRTGAVASTDISLPIGAIAEFIDRAAGVVRRVGDFRTNCFGHVGDGNLHFNIFPMPGQKKSDFPDAPAKLRRVIHDLVAELDGSFSAEHGVGRLKTEDLERYGDPTRLSAMRAIKAALDPNGIMNPGAVLSDARKT